MRCPVPKTILLAALLAAAAAGPALGQSKTGTTMGQFLLIEPSARIAGMGNAGVTTDDPLQGVYYNPAALGQATHYGVSFSHSLWLADIAYDYVAATLPMGNWGNGFFCVTALNSGDIAVRTVAQPLGTGQNYTVSDVAVGVGWGRQISYRFAAGAQVNYVQETIWNSSAATMTVNVGTLYRLSERGLHIGASLSNFGTHEQFNGRDLSITFDQDPTRFGDNGALPGQISTDPFAMPVLFRVGVGLPRKVGDDGRLLMAVDAFHPSDNTESVSAGAEYAYKSMLAVRAGYQNLFEHDSELGLTLGAGVAGRVQSYDYRFDYAWADQGRLGSTHRFTLALTF